MTDIAIRVDHLGKAYQISHEQSRRKYFTLQEEIVGLIKRPFSRNGKKSETFWALKDISFEVRAGEALGIIGRNGAGKSTLLKILSRITRPTTGYADIFGRVGSLLEVGTGFHPELTGRENIYLNGAVLGMTRRDIQRRFDEIVAFAEVEKFLDTPTKRYSSGMYMRLAFAVAAHLEPEILVVDEVLAVGDVAFQKKCLGKMGDVASSGKAVIFVSHQMNAVRKLCNTAIWLDSGRIKEAGTTSQLISAYEANFVKEQIVHPTEERSTQIGARFLSWEIVEPKAEQSNMLTTTGPLVFKIGLEVRESIQNGIHGIALWNNEHQLMWGWAAYNLHLEPGVQEFFYTLPSLPLRPGLYSLQASLYDGARLMDDWYAIPDLIIATEPLAHPNEQWAGFLNIPCGFKTSVLTGTI